MNANPSVASVATELRARLTPDKVLVPGAPYEKARRICNGAMDHRPALIVRPETSAEVQGAVLTARDNHLPVSVRGGHDWAGCSLRDGGLVIDLARMRLRSLSIRGTDRQRPGWRHRG